MGLIREKEVMINSWPLNILMKGFQKIIMIIFRSSTTYSQEGSIFMIEAVKNPQKI